MNRERLSSIGENVTRVHDHIMEKGARYSAFLGSVSVIGGLLKQDPYSIVGGFAIVGGAIIVSSVDSTHDFRGDDKSK